MYSLTTIALLACTATYITNAVPIDYEYDDDDDDSWTCTPQVWSHATSTSEYCQKTCLDQFQMPTYNQNCEYYSSGGDVACACDNSGGELPCAPSESVTLSVEAISCSEWDGECDVGYNKIEMSSLYCYDSTEITLDIDTDDGYCKSQCCDKN
eukprot:Pgem_evm1s9726